MNVPSQTAKYVVSSPQNIVFREEPYHQCITDLERSRLAHETLRRQSRLKGRPGWKSIKAPRTFS
jgi:hypothetical protein